ncbi:MAG: AAA family ATPase [Nitrososphaerales archaeon]
MVFIKKMDARGFKSLGNKTVSIKFDQDFTAITGPNGSGKSNIIDAIIFCLGQNSPKKLRVDRLTSLIYDGGPSVKRPQTIRVTITFDNSTRRIPVDSDTVTVTRELRQTGENRYLLNGKRIAKTALTELLSLALIAPEGLNLVPQGMITRLSELIPDEKRGLIEEIVGVAQFDEKKRRSLEHLREADTKLQVALARIGEMKNRVESLECEMNDQLRLKTLEDDIRWLKAVIASRNLADVKRRIVEEKKLLEEYNVSHGKLQNDLEELDRQIEAAEDERKEFVSNVIDSSGGRRVELEFAIGRTESEITLLKEEVSSAEDLTHKIESSRPYLRNMREQQEHEIASLQSRIEEEEAKMAELEKAKKDAEDALRKIDRRQTKLQTVLEKKNAQVENLRKRISKYNEKFNETTRQIETSKNKRTLTGERLQILKDKSRTFLETLAHLEDQLKKLEDLARMEKESIKKVGSSLTDLADREVKLQEEVAKALSTLKRANDAVLRYEAQRSVAEKIVADELGLRRLEDLAKTGALEGFVGRVDKLVSYPSKYEPAVLAAGRRWMKAAVVRDIHAMLKIVEVAKRFKIGRITIIPLSEVSNSKRVRLPRDEGLIGTLADVMSCDKELEGMVNFLFGDMVLADTSRDGYIASSKGFKSVTSSGDLFEPRGVAFETGYVAKMDEILDLVQDEASFATVKEALKSLQSTISKRKSDVDQLQSEAKMLTGEKSRRSIVLERMKAETSAVTGFIKKYRKLKKEIDARVKRYARAVERIDNSIGKLGATQTAINTKIGKYEAKIVEVAPQKVSDELESLEEEKTVKRRFIEDVSRQLRDTVTQLTKDRGNLEHNLKPSFSRLEEQIERSEETLKEKKQVIEEGTERLKELSEKLGRLKSDEMETIEKTKKSRPILESYENQLNRLRKDRDGLKRSLNNIEKEVISTGKSIERLGESERNLLGEITLYGYNEPVEVFETADALLEQLNLEYGRLKNNVNLLAVSSYREVFSGYKNLSVRRNQLEAERNAIVKFIEEVDAEKRRVFITGFEKIDRELRSIFSKLTGGSAWLELEDPDDIFSKGVFLMTQFPDKLPRESSAMSGGEKTVSALSIILAIQSVYPSPFYLFDEIDAHLDVVNAERLADLLRDRAETAQIITVTLKETMLARASLVYGLYMEKGTSKIIKYRPGVEVVARSG